jgi:hypothetical protein
MRLRVFTICALLLVSFAANAVAKDVVFSEGVAHHTERHDDRDAVLTFGNDTLTLVIDARSDSFAAGPGGR